MKYLKRILSKLFSIFHRKKQNKSEVEAGGGGGPIEPP